MTSFRHTRRSPRALLGLLTTTAALLAIPAAAGAAVSSNWSGYAIHRHGVQFTHATGSWTIPKVTCSAKNNPAYAADWVGIGGYEQGSPALEQTGTETDCTRAGRQRTYAWYEIVPAPSRPLRMKVHPGDSITATVLVVGHKVTLTLVDNTTHTTGQKVRTVRAVDTTSAEWIVEAPSECSSPSRCTVLPLANFGTVDFTQSTAQTANGQSGPISSSLWGRTKISLATGHHSLFSNAPRSLAAVPSPLTADGQGFEVDYKGKSSTNVPYPMPPTSTSPSGPGGGSGPGLSATLKIGTAWYVQPGGGRMS